MKNSGIMKTLIGVCLLFTVLISKADENTIQLKIGYVT